MAKNTEWRRQQCFGKEANHMFNRILKNFTIAVQNDSIIPKDGVDSSMSSDNNFHWELAATR